MLGIVYIQGLVLWTRGLEIRINAFPSFLACTVEVSVIYLFNIFYNVSPISYQQHRFPRAVRTVTLHV